MKELNLYKFLKNAKPEDLFYSTLYGDTSIVNLFIDAVDISPYNDTKNITTIFINGTYSRTSKDVLLWPSYDLYMKYPFDAVSAWEEWGKTNVKTYIKVKVVQEDTQSLIDDTIINITKVQADEIVEKIKELLKLN